MPGKTSSAGKRLTASSPDRRSLSVSVIGAQPRHRLRALTEREHLFAERLRGPEEPYHFVLFPDCADDSMIREESGWTL
jgi:hypothetical protein